jgi:hypothetical protein
MKINKKYLSLLLITVLIISLYQTSANADTNVVKGNLFIHSTSSDFNTNAGLEGVEISNNIGDGAIVLKSGVLKGVYTSNIINTSPFENLVLSWDSDTPEGTSIQIEAKVFARRLDSNGQWTEKWSDWLS